MQHSWRIVNGGRGHACAPIAVGRTNMILAAGLYGHACIISGAVASASNKTDRMGHQLSRKSRRRLSI